MKRRALLAGLAAASAGCISDPGVGAGDPDTTTRARAGDDATTDDPSSTTDPTTDPGDDADTDSDDSDTATDDEPTDPDADGYDPEWNPDGDPVAEITIGSRDDVADPGDNRPQSIAVWNDTGAAADVDVVVERDATQVVDRTLALADGAWLALDLQAPADYRITVRVDGELRWRERFPASSFTCNSTFMNVALGPDGAVATVRGSTALACLDPEIEGVDLEAGDGSCADATDHAATVAFDDDSIRVDGTVITPVPCYDLAVDDAGTAIDDGELTVSITAEREDGVCVECVGAVPYEATVDLGDALPDTVVVAHVVDGERTVVARESR